MDVPRIISLQEGSGHAGPVRSHDAITASIASIACMARNAEVVPNGRIQIGFGNFFSTDLTELTQQIIRIDVQYSFRFLQQSTGTN